MIDNPIIYIVDDEQIVCEGMELQLSSLGFKVKTFCSGDEFLSSLPQDVSGCVILDVRMPDMTGTKIQTVMLQRNIKLPIIFLSGYADVPVVVNAVHKGAIDFLTKPVDRELLLNCINKALEANERNQQLNLKCRTLQNRLNRFTQRESEVFELVREGYTSKKIAKQLNLSIRTIEHHRSHILLKTEAINFTQLGELVDACS